MDAHSGITKGMVRSKNRRLPIGRWSFYNVLKNIKTKDMRMTIFVKKAKISVLYTLIL